MPPEAEQPGENETSPQDIESILQADGRYKLEAYSFLHEALARAVQDVHGGSGDSNHVTGQELCAALRDLAIDRYGLMAPAVFRSWGIRQSLDFGQMVYLLIEHNVMRKTDEDSLDDFRDVFDLDRDFQNTDSITMSE